MARQRFQVLDPYAFSINCTVAVINNRFESHQRHGASVARLRHSIVSQVVDSLRIDAGALRGQVILPEDADYDTHRRIWNGSIDRHPALIMRCAGVADVIAAVKFGQASGMPVAVRSGGHFSRACLSRTTRSS